MKKKKFGVFRLWNMSYDDKVQIKKNKKKIKKTKSVGPTLLTCLYQVKFNSFVFFSFFLFVSFLLHKFTQRLFFLLLLLLCFSFFLSSSQTHSKGHFFFLLLLSFSFFLLLHRNTWELISQTQKIKPINT